MVVLEYMISDPRYSLEGFKLSDGNFLLEMFFADDTMLFLNGSKSNLD